MNEYEELNLRVSVITKTTLMTEILKKSTHYYKRFLEEKGLYEEYKEYEIGIKKKELTKIAESVTDREREFIANNKDIVSKTISDCLDKGGLI